MSSHWIARVEGYEMKQQFNRSSGLSYFGVTGGGGYRSSFIDKSRPFIVLTDRVVTVDYNPPASLMLSPIPDSMKQRLLDLMRPPAEGCPQ